MLPRSLRGFINRIADKRSNDTIMPEKDVQLAVDYVLEILKKTKDIVNIYNYLDTDTRKTAFGGKYKEVDKDAIVEAWTNLFLDGWIGPDPTQMNGDLVGGWLRITSYGKSQLESIGEDYYPVFLDPVSTISRLKDTIPNIDPLALKYFEESLWAIKKHLFLSAIVTMGCASECSILQLIDEMLDYYDDTNLQERFSRSDKIKFKYELFKKTLEERGLKKELLSLFASDQRKYEDLKRLLIDFDTIIDRMFQIYRTNRNDAGHPSGIEFDQDITRAEAAMFRKYCRIIYGLIAYINEAKRLKETESCI